jgi:hypothetical protein
MGSIYAMVEDGLTGAIIFEKGGPPLFSFSKRERERKRRYLF